MSYLHSHEIIHRDLKPANILEDENIFPKIADFGLSKINHYNIESMTSQSTVSFKGTPIYTAPEMWNNYEYSKASDVYAFSFIVYEILTLNEPFKNYNIDMLLSKVVGKGDRPELNIMIPNCYKSLIERCWSSNPNDRPTFQEIVEELKTNKEFIIDTIDEEEYFNYVDMIDDSEYLFDPNKKLKSIIPTGEQKEENYPTIEGKINETEEDEYLTNMTVGMFNNLPLKTQQSTISDIIKSKGKLSVSNSLLNMNKLLLYFQQFDLQQEVKYFCITTKDEETQLEEIFESAIKITLFHEIIEHLSEKESISTSELNNYFNYFDTIYMEIKYPTTTFERNYKKILNLKEKNEERIRINIFISGINKTDMRFQNDENINSVLIDEGVTEITGGKIGFKNTGGGTFYGCSSLTQITIPSSVTSIGKYSFCGCSSLTQITIPLSLKSIEQGTFSECTSLEEIQIPSSVTSIGSKAFFGCTSLCQLTIPSSVTKIEDRAFFGCLKLTQISIPPSLTQFGKGIFNKCKEITLTNDIINIPEHAFTECKSLTQLTIISSEISIGTEAFHDCSSLKQIFIRSSKICIKQIAFYMCKSLEKILFEIPSSATSIKQYCFDKNSSLNQDLNDYFSVYLDSKIFYYSFCLKQFVFEVPSSIKSIEENSFNGFMLLTEVLFKDPSSLTKIGDYAFKDCISLAKISIPSSVIQIGKYCFYECLSLKQISIPSSVEKIDGYPSLKIIGEYSFYKCLSLTQISIPPSVTKIGYGAFSGCKSLKQINIPSSVTEIGYNAFCNCFLLEEITFEVPSSLTFIAYGTFKGCSSLKQIIIPSSVTEIKEKAFKKCSSLTNVTFENPCSLKSIGIYAFKKSLFIKLTTLVFVI